MLAYSKFLLNWVAALAAVVAALLWFRSATVEVPTDDIPDENGMFGMQITVDGSDFIETARQQTRWNKWAAFAAGIAAGCQAVALMIPS